MTLFFGILAGLGALLAILGRRLIIEDARSFSDGWVWAIRFLPLADLMYLARFWDSAKTGAFMSLAGLVLMLPAGGKALWDKKHPSAHQQKGATLGLLDADTKNGYFQAMKDEHQERIARKEQKIQMLNARLAAWYQSMESRRPALANAAPAEIAAFNDEAAAYSALQVIDKTETEELTTLRAKHYDSWSSITNEEYREYLDRTDRLPRKSKAGGKEGDEAWQEEVDVR
jgi:hypothetical protein